MIGVVPRHLGGAPQAHEEDDEGQAQIIEFRSEEQHGRSHIPWIKGTIEDLIKFNIT